jgi:hypothetical protein
MATTWNPSDKGADIALSGGNLVATKSNTTGQGVRATNGVLSGEKKYFEYTVTTFAPAGHQIGVSNTGYDPTIDTPDALNSPYAVVYLRNGSVTLGGVLMATIEVFNTADVIGVAVDRSNNRIWFKRNAGNWNNDAAADPATNTNGIDISGITSSGDGTLSPTAAYAASGNVGTLNAGASAYTQTPPSGFTNITEALMGQAAL